jgi:hypothetical protein
MATLDPNNFADMNTYHFLVIWKLTAQPVGSVGDYQVKSLGYWNDADTGASQQAGSTASLNLQLYCLQYAATLGTQWLSADEKVRAAATTKLTSLLTTAKSIISDVSKQLGQTFSFTSSAIPSSYATKLAQIVAQSQPVVPSHKA